MTTNWNNWASNIGEKLIKSVSVEFGGQSVRKMENINGKLIDVTGKKEDPFHIKIKDRVLWRRVNMEGKVTYNYSDFEYETPEYLYFYLQFSDKHSLSEKEVKQILEDVKQNENRRTLIPLF